MLGHRFRMTTKGHEIKRGQENLGGKQHKVFGTSEGSIGEVCYDAFTPIYILSPKTSLRTQGGTFEYLDCLKPRQSLWLGFLWHYLDRAWEAVANCRFRF